MTPVAADTPTPDDGTGASGRRRRPRRGRAPARARALLRRARRLAGRAAHARGWRLGAGLSLGLLLIACAAAGVAERVRPAAPAYVELAGGPVVRVALLARVPEVVVLLEGDAWVLEPDSGEPAVVASPGTLVVRPVGGGLAAVSSAASVGFPSARRLVLRATPWSGGSAGPEPLPPTFVLGERRFRGELRVTRLAPDREGGEPALSVVNALGIEEYLSGVLGREMPLSWPDAALHAQAIAARTYALVGLRPGRDHDLEADTRSQVYGGIGPDDARARALVAETRGIVLAHRGRPFPAFFSSTCGGRTAPGDEGLGVAPIPPLAGVTGCPCDRSRYFRWTAEVDLAAPPRGLELALPLRACTVERWPRGGRVRRLTLLAADGRERVLSGDEARTLLGLRSTAFEVTAEGSRLVVAGRGWGHGVGLCQWGARALAEQGRDALAILGFYYPGAEVQVLPRT